MEARIFTTREEYLTATAELITRTDHQEEPILEESENLFENKDLWACPLS